MGWACICRYGGVGDNLIASSVFGPLKKKYGYLEVITQTPQSCVFENSPYIDKLTIHKAGEIPGGLKEWHDWHRVRGLEYDFFANLSHSLETETALLPLESKTLWPAKYRRQRFGKSYVQVVADICDVPFRECKPEFFPTEEEDALATQTLGEQIKGRPCIGWVLSGTRIDKIYPASTMAIARLIEELGAHVVLFGAPGRDRDMALQIQDFVAKQNGSTDNLHGAVDEKFENQTWPVRRILTQLRHCDLVITPDTGPAWAVAHHTVPKIVMVSHASPENITKGWFNTVTLHADPAKVPCWPCHLLHDSLDTCVPDDTGKAAACISSIPVSAIIREARSLISGGHPFFWSKHEADHQRHPSPRKDSDDGGQGTEEYSGQLQPERHANGSDTADRPTP